MYANICAQARQVLAAIPPESVRVAGSGVSLDVAGYRVRLEAAHGDQQRVAIVAALAAMPQLLADLTDELERQDLAR